MLFTFTDIDECAAGACVAGGGIEGCTNNDGSYACSCSTGFALDAGGLTCSGK